jgi:four helix bundle protein
MRDPSNLRVLDAARAAVDDVNHWLDSRPTPVPDAVQLREAAGSITANIREAYGRDEGPDRNRFLGYSRGSAEETDERLRTAFKATGTPEKHYWPRHNRLVVIGRMLTALMQPSGPEKRKKRRRPPRK